MKIELDKPMKLLCTDYMGEYTIVGEFKMLHKGWKKPKFCVFNIDQNKWEPSDEWFERESWEYLKQKSEGGEG